MYVKEGKVAILRLDLSRQPFLKAEKETNLVLRGVFFWG